MEESFDGVGKDKTGERVVINHTFWWLLFNAAVCILSVLQVATATYGTTMYIAGAFTFMITSVVFSLRIFVLPFFERKLMVYSFKIVDIYGVALVCYENDGVLWVASVTNARLLIKLKQAQEAEIRVQSTMIDPNMAEKIFITLNETTMELRKL